MRPAELPGRLLERRSNASSRGMIAPFPQGNATEPGLSADFPLFLIPSRPSRSASCDLRHGKQVAGFSPFFTSHFQLTFNLL